MEAVGDQSDFAGGWREGLLKKKAPALTAGAYWIEVCDRDEF